MGVLVSDDFNRAGGPATPVGNGWTEQEDSSTVNVQIVSNQLWLDGDVGTSYRGVYRSSSQNNGIVITGEVTIPNIQGSDFMHFYVLVLSGSNFTTGFGMKVEMDDGAGNGYVAVVDNASELATSSNMTIDNDTYNFEMEIADDYAIDIRFWSTSGSRPSSPDVSYTASTPSASGSNYAIHYSAPGIISFGGTVTVDNFQINELHFVDVSSPVSYTDNISIFKAIFANIQSALSYTDTIQTIPVRVVNLILSISITEVFSFQYVWDKFAKSVTSWTKPSKNSTSYTKQTKSSTSWNLRNKS